MDKKELSSILNKIGDSQELLNDAISQLRKITDFKNMPYEDTKELWALDSLMSESYLDGAKAFLKLVHIMDKMEDKK